MEKELIYRYMNDDELLRITNTIRHYEKFTAGEISVSIKEKTPFSLTKKTTKEIAEAEFFRLGLDKTRDKTGILILLLLKEKSFYILADAGINEKVESHTWDKIKDNMQEMFAKGEFSRGIISAVEQTGKILAEYFPVKPDDKNELPDRVNIG
jgi:uncharacterized membrane protein